MILQLYQKFDLKLTCYFLININLSTFCDDKQFCILVTVLPLVESERSAAVFVVETVNILRAIE